MENNSVVLKRQQNTPFNINICTICQNEKVLKNMINSVNIRRDKVYERLQLPYIVGHKSTRKYTIHVRRH